MKLHLNSIIIFVQHIQQLKLFYVDILGLELVEETENQWLLLKAGYFTIGLHAIGQQYTGKNQTEYKFENNTKLVFETDEDLHELRERLLAKSVLLREIATWDNYDYWLCDGEDPEGNVFQLKQKKS
jgi:catechol 2,3-dioxygenase-like lactoylglutathione lyase family enzyme